MSDVRPECYQLRDALEASDFAAASALLENDPSLNEERTGIGETVQSKLRPRSGVGGLNVL